MDTHSQTKSIWLIWLTTSTSSILLWSEQCAGTDQIFLQSDMKMSAISKRCRCNKITVLAIFTQTKLSHFLLRLRHVVNMLQKKCLFLLSHQSWGRHQWYANKEDQSTALTLHLDKRGNAVCNVFAEQKEHVAQEQRWPANKRWTKNVTNHLLKPHHDHRVLTTGFPINGTGAHIALSQCLVNTLRFAVEPVNATPAMLGWEVSALPISEPLPGREVE